MSTLFRNEDLMQVPLLLQTLKKRKCHKMFTLIDIYNCFNGLTLYKKNGFLNKLYQKRNSKNNIDSCLVEIVLAPSAG